MSVGQITLTSVTKRFGDTVAVDDVSLQIEGGEFFSLLGPSGCGKNDNATHHRRICVSDHWRGSYQR